MLRERAMEDRWRVASGGIAPFARDGALVSLDARLVLRDEGIDLPADSVATDLKRNRHLITEADLILAMTDEQIRMLRMTLDAMDEAHRDGRTPTRELIDAYMTGDLTNLTDTANDSMRAEPDLYRKFTALGLDGRNRLMAERIVARRAERPNKSCFFAVGALHYAGAEGIVALLQRQGLRVSRVDK